MPSKFELLLILAVLNAFFGGSTGSSENNANFFETPSSDEQILSATARSGSIFVFTNRRILKLDENSFKALSEKTFCSPETQFFCPKIDGDDVNTAFLTLNQDQQLIACSRVIGGDVNCSSVNVNLDNFTKFNSARLVENSISNQINSLTGVLAPLKSGYPALYVGIGVKRSENFEITQLPPAISIRSARSESQSSFLITKPSMSLYYRTGEFSQRESQYFGAISKDGFTYFLSISRRFDAESLTSTIGRVCQNDTEFRSYVETDFNCKRNQGLDDDLVVFDTLVGIYPDFVESSAGQQLIVAMSTSPKRKGASKLSTVCAIDWIGLNAHLDSTVRRCVLDGSGNFGLENLRRYGDNQQKFTNTNRCTKPQRSSGSSLVISGGSADNNNKEAAELLCGKYSSELNSPLRAVTPFSAMAIITENDREISAIAADNRAQSSDDTVRLFVLWQNGDFQKFEIVPSLSTRQLNPPVTIARKIFTTGKTTSNNKVALFFHSSHEFVFIVGASNRRIYQLPTANCGPSASSPLTCNTCLKSTPDLDCGWCYSSSSCSTEKQCSGGKWLPKRDQDLDNRCVELAKVVHPDVPVGQSGVQLQLHVTGGSATLKRLSLGNFICRFEGLDVETRGDETNFGIRCPSPFQNDEQESGEETNFLTTINEKIKVEGSLKTKLSLLAVDSSNSSRAQFVLLQTLVTFYNCSSFSNCSSCSSAPFACQWCVSPSNNGSVCQDFDKTSCPTPATIVSEHIPLPTVTGPIGPSYCPTIQPVNNKRANMLVPAFIAHHLTVQVENFQLFGNLSSKQLTCIVTFEGKTVHLPASFVGNKNSVTCDVHEFNITEAEVIGQLSISFDNNEENLPGNAVEPEKIPIQLFACELLSSDCSTCLSLQASPRLAEYHCRWCGNECTFSARCPLAADSHCTNVRITRVTPLMAPTEGLTTFTIMGENLGYSFEQIRYGVRVASIPCNPIKELYEVSRKIVCILDASPNDAEISGAVEILFSDSNQKTLSQEKVRIVRPSIVSFEPVRGPSSGGSLVTITGTNLLVGNNVTVHIGNGGRLCSVIKEASSDTTLRCLTAPGEPGLEAPLLVAFDGRVFIHGGKMFRYTQDPVITHISPLTSFSSGGRHIYVHGKNFLSIRNPMIGVKFPSRNVINNNQNDPSSGITVDPTMVPCHPNSDFLLICRTPPLPKEDNFQFMHLQLIGQNQPVANGQLFFQMDGVKSVRHLERFYPKVASQIDYYQDPSFYKFTENGADFKAPKLQIGNSLVMEGEIINLAAGESDVEVHIGDRINCNVTAISSKQLVCTLDESQMALFEQYTVRITVGYLNFSIGNLQRFMPPSQESAFSGLNVEALVGCAIGSVLLLITGTVFCCLLVRRSRQARRNYEKVRLQLDSLESNVRTECKLAFAELQTEMGVVNGIVGSSGSCAAFSEIINPTCPPPVRDFDAYLLNFLFPSMPEHPCRVLASEHESLDRGLEHFDLLLSNKQFLGIFIRVLEEQKSFGVRDRVNVASLLCLAFVNRPEYLTDITLSLIGELAAKSAEKKHPKLMLRRTESVAERLLSNWLSIVLYQWVSERLSGPLYTLYRALKHQLEKGPIDAITYEAKYSLSEEKLLKENIAYKVITVNVRACFEQIHQPFTTQCRLLSCDSISQAKSKIIDQLTFSIANSPFWGVKADDLDLLWSVSDDENVILTETDSGDSVMVSPGGGNNGLLTLSGTLGKNSGGAYRTQNGEYFVVHLNTLQTYGILDGSTLIVVHRLASHNHCALLSTTDTHSSGGVSTTSSSAAGDSTHRSPTSPRLSSAAALLGSLTMSRNVGNNLDDSGNRLNSQPGNKQPQTSAIGSLRRYCSLRLGGGNKANNNRWDGKTRQENNNFASTQRTGCCPQRIRYVHLVQSNDFRSSEHANLPNSTSPKQQDSQTSCRNIPEIYLTRLLTTKGTLQKYVDDLFSAIFDVSDGNNSPPAAIRYLYTRLDDLAAKLGPAAGGCDPAEIAYTWKCNSLPLRFLVNLLKNPDFVLDVEKPPTVDSSLSVLGQLLMDACSMSEYRLGKDSPTNKLLFAREISRYRSMVQAFMANAQRAPCYDQAEALHDFAALGISTGTTSQLSRRSAVLELYKYSVRYHMEILEALESQISTRSFVNHLSQQAYSPSQRSEESSSPSTASSNLPTTQQSSVRPAFF